jgi:hypothetical protein
MAATIFVSRSSMNRGLNHTFSKKSDGIREETASVPVYLTDNDGSPAMGGFQCLARSDPRL